MKSKIFITTIIVILSISVISLIGWMYSEPAPVLMQGELNAKSYKISSQMPGRVDSLPVRRGQIVQKGEFIYRVTSQTINAKLSQAVAVREVATAQKIKADKGVRKQIINSAYQMLKSAEEGRVLAEKTFKRVKNLYEEGVVSEQRFDEVSAQYNVAINNKKVASQQYQLAKAGAQYEDKVSAAALVSQADGAVAEVESYLNDSYQYSPVKGEVSSIIAEQGELVGAGIPVVTVVDMNDTWAVFNIKETLLKKFTKGRRFTANIPAVDKDVEFEVTFISPEASYATWAATRTTGEFDIKTFEVHARPTTHVDNLYVGMSVIVNYDTL